MNKMIRKFSEKNITEICIFSLNYIPEPKENKFKHNMLIVRKPKSVRDLHEYRIEEVRISNMINSYSNTLDFDSLYSFTGSTETYNTLSGIYHPYDEDNRSNIKFNPVKFNDKRYLCERYILFSKNPFIKRSKIFKKRFLSSIKINWKG